GEITRDAAEKTGLTEGTPVFAAASDKACEVLGAGGLTPDVGCLSYGTTATINTTHERYVEPVPLLPPYPAAVPRAYNLEVQVYRAILEGLAFALREGKERTEKRSGVPIRELRVAGGGSQSDAAMQITADVFGLPASRPHVYEASGLGAAIDAAVGVGIHPD